MIVVYIMYLRGTIASNESCDKMSEKSGSRLVSLET